MAVDTNPVKTGQSITFGCEAENSSDNQNMQFRILKQQDQNFIETGIQSPAVPINKNVAIWETTIPADFGSSTIKGQCRICNHTNEQCTQWGESTYKQ